MPRFYGTPAGATAAGDPESEVSHQAEPLKTLKPRVVCRHCLFFFFFCQVGLVFDEPSGAACGALRAPKFATDSWIMMIIYNDAGLKAPAIQLRLFINPGRHTLV